MTLDRAQGAVAPCWSCRENRGGGLICPSCGAIQPPSASPDRFAILGVPRRFDLDGALLEERYHELSRRLHPDHFARAGARERMLSLSAATALNDAYRALRVPVKRAEHLLALAGVTVGEKEQADPAFLAEVLEWREGLAEARGDEPRVAAMEAEMIARRDAAMAEVAGLLDGEPAAEALAAAKGRLVAVRYMNRFLDEIAAGRETR
jgi:molecular chaperone HscB